MRSSFGWAALLVIMAACGDDGGTSGSGGAAIGAGGSTTGGSGGSGAVIAQNCPSRCEAKAASCGAPASVAQAACASICSQGVTEDQANCLETSSCAVLEAAMGGGAAPCGIGAAGSAGSVGAGGTSGAGGSEASGTKKLGEACDCPDSGNWVTCKGTDSPCLPDLTCVEFGDEKKCTQSCTPGSCGAGLSCTELNIGVDMGDWCW